MCGRFFMGVFAWAFLRCLFVGGNAVLLWYRAATLGGPRWVVPCALVYSAATAGLKRDARVITTGSTLDSKAAYGGTYKYRS